MARLLSAVLLVVVACSAGDTGQTATTTASTEATTTTGVPTTTTSTIGPAAAGHLVKLDPLTLDPVPGLDPMVLTAESWTMLSDDGTLLLLITWDTVDRINRGTTIDVDRWEQVGAFQFGPSSGRAFHEDSLYIYIHPTGELGVRNLFDGGATTLDEWPAELWLWDDLHIVSGGRVAALATRPVEAEGNPDYSVFVYDPDTGETREFPVGPLERITEKSPATDSPGVVWDDDRVLLIHAEGPEITEIDLDTGHVETHLFTTTSWWDRVLAYWMPAAAAKGPSAGTNSSGALSPDGRYLYISGNQYEVVTNEDGTLVEENTHLGLTVVDTETWKIVDSPDLPIQFVTERRGMIFGVDTLSTQPWVDNYYLLTTDDQGVVEHRVPHTNREGNCEPTLDQARLYCFRWGDTGVQVELVDLTSLETISKRTIGQEDVLHHNAVLEDWVAIH